MTTVLYISDDDGTTREVEVEVATSIINNSCYFKDLVSYTNVQNCVLFPPQYNNVVNIYLDYAKEVGVEEQTKVKTSKYTLTQLKLAFELCHYLDDNIFLAWLMRHTRKMWKYIIGNKDNIIDKLHPNIQRDIYLHVPLCFVPIALQGTNSTNSNDIINSNNSDYQQSEKFIRDWVAINKGKRYTTNGYEYKTVIEYYDSNGMDIKKLTCLRESFISEYHEHGVTKSWHPLTLDGKKLLSEETYYSNGKKHGTYTNWYSTGYLGRICDYHNGKIHGKDIMWWYPAWIKYGYHQCKTRLMSITEYHHGVEHGSSTKYYSNGQTEQQGCYDNGKKCGEWRLWYPSGNIRCITSFNNDVRCSIYKEYYDTQQHDFMKEYHFDDQGRKCDTFKMWWPPSQSLPQLSSHESSHKLDADDCHPTKETQTNQLKYYYKCRTAVINSSTRYVEWDEKGNCIRDINGDDGSLLYPHKIRVYTETSNSGLIVTYEFN